MKTRISCLLLAIIFLISVPVEAMAAVEMPGAFREETLRGAPKDYENLFKNVVHNVALDPGHDQLCKRKLTGEITFDWPEPSTYVDVVFIQDFSGSFKNTIDEVGDAVETMIGSLNMGKDEAGYPKDRAMIVTFQEFSGYRGEVGEDSLEISYQSSEDYKVEKRTSLLSDKETLTSWVDANFVAGETNGGTPTVDGVALAQRSYEEEIQGGEVYNRASYKVNGKDRKRKTVYILITDGAANVATWNDLSEDGKTALGVTDYEVTHYRKGGYYYDYSDVALLWTDESKRPDGAYYNVGSYSRTEAYGAMLDSLKEQADTLRAAGGPMDSSGSGRTQATVVTAFWEDQQRLAGTTGGYGTNWAGMAPKIKNALLNMADNNPWYFATSNTNIHDFTEKLIRSFKKAATAIFDQVSVEAPRGLTGSGIALYEKIGNTGNDNYDYREVPLSGGSVLSGEKMIVDMSNQTVGSYKILYKMSELEFKPEGYVPSFIKMVFEDKEVDIGTEEGDPNGGFIPGNPRTDCEITLNKKVSLLPDPGLGSDFQILDKQRQEFYWKVGYTFTKKVFDAQGKMEIIDVVDPRLEVLKAEIFPGNLAAQNDGTEGVIASSTLSGNRKISIEGNRVFYSLPKQPKTVSGIEFPFGGYDGKQYILVVKVKLKDSITDLQIADMYAPDPQDNRQMGIPNIGELEIDGGKISSNKAKALPPRTALPSIKKYVRSDETTVYWQSIAANLKDDKENFSYSLDVKIPEDTTGYRKLVVEDKLDPALTFGDRNFPNGTKIELTYGLLDPDEELIDPVTISTEEYAVDEEALRNGHLIVTIEDRSLFEALQGKTLSVEFKVKIKSPYDIMGHYNSGTNRFVFPNTGRVKVNELTNQISNEVKVSYPVGRVLLKKEDTARPGTFLPGAEFTVKDNSDNTATVVTTGSDGTVTLTNLSPGRTYTVTETKAPQGYIGDNGSWTVTVDGRGAVKVQKVGESAPLEGTEILVGNVKPVLPTPEKSLKGSREGATFIQPTESSPYKMSGFGEIITYEIKVPIESVEGYSELKITDTVDQNFIPEWSTIQATTEKEGGGEEPLSGNFETSARTFVWTKTGDFTKIRGSVKIRFRGRLDPTAWERVFADGNDGKIRNKATVQLNGGPGKETNTVVSQVTRGEVSISKKVQEANTYVPLPENMEAIFTLYKVLGEPDTVDEGGNVIPDTGTTADKAVATVQVKGPDPVTTGNLEPGDYYYVEVSPPGGFLKEPGRIPRDGFLKVTEIGGTVILPTVEAKDQKASDPTVYKGVKGGNRPEYSSEDYKIEEGETWQYALDITLPSNTDTQKPFILVDDIEKDLEVMSLPPVVSSDVEGTMAVDARAQEWLVMPTGWNGDRNHIELVIPANKVAEYSGHVIRIEVAVKVKDGVNLLASNALTSQGKLPNYVYLYKGDKNHKIDEDVVFVLPSLQRDVVFKKTLEGAPLTGAVFTLYHYVTGTEEDIKEENRLKIPGEDNYYEEISGTDGMVVFEKVPAGRYWMVEIGSPPGVVASYPGYRVVVSDDSNIPYNDNRGVTFFTPGGQQLFINHGELWNNSLVEFPVEKKWVGDSELNTRPEKITVALYRIVEEGDEPEFIGEKDLSRTNEWQHVFKTETLPAGSKTMYKYQVTTNKPYRYFAVEQDPSPLYDHEVSDDGHLFTNTLKSYDLPLLKRDGKTAEPLTGIVFTLTGPDGRTQDVTAKNGVVLFKNLKAGVTYQLSEKKGLDTYILKQGSLSVTLGPDGTPTFRPYTFEWIDPDDNPDTNNSGYLVKNYKIPTPEKKVNDQTRYTLKEYGETVTYTIKVPLLGTEDISKLLVTDTVDPAMKIIPGSGDVYLEGHPEESLAEAFQIYLSDDQRTAEFMIQGQEIKNFENKNLIFSFQGQIAVGPEKLGELHPDGVIPNKGFLILNDRPDHKTQTNVVNLETSFGQVTLQKTLEQTSGDSINADSKTKATFRLELKVGEAWDDDDQVLGLYTTDERGQIEVRHLPKGTYRFVETKSPEGYIPGSPIEFTVDGDHQNIDVTVENPHEELPELHKMVKGLREGDELHETYDLETWKDSFLYTVDVVIPDNPNYTRAQFEDLLPSGIVVDKNEDIGVEAGTGFGNSFVKEVDISAEYPEFQLAKVTPTIRQGEEGRVRLYSDSWEYGPDGISATALIFKVLKGKTLRFTYKAHLKEGYKDISQFATDEEGYIVNRAKIVMDGKFEKKDTAKVRPSKQYGIVIQKIADFKRTDGSVQPLAGAVFTLERYRDDKAKEIGPALPDGIATEYVSDKDGFISIEKALVEGFEEGEVTGEYADYTRVPKYRLLERTAPHQYVDEEGNSHNVNFGPTYKEYVLTLGVPLGTEEKGILLSGIGQGEEGPVEREIFKGISSKENPAQVINRQQIAIPVKKVWEDEDDAHGLRPKTVEFTLQRAVVKGAVDTIGPDGTLTPLEGDLPDVPDTAFNRDAGADSKNHVVWTSGSGILFFRSEELYRYNSNMERYNYYVLEKTLEDYAPSYKMVNTGAIMPEGTDLTGLGDHGVEITNRLKTSGGFILKKVDDRNGKVSGASFNLSYTLPSGNQVVTTKTSDEQGEINFGTLAPDRTYTLVETEAPVGYEKNPDTYTVLVDNTGKVKVYTKYVADGSEENIEVTGEEFTFTPGTTEEAPGLYTLRVVDKIRSVLPEKKVNGADSYTLTNLKEDLLYTVEVPVEDVTNMKKFVMEDTLHTLLQFVSSEEDVTVTAGGRDVKSYGLVKIDGQKITFTMTDHFEKIANCNVVMTFTGKVARSYETLGELKEAMATAGVGGAAITTIDNKATVHFDDRKGDSNVVKVTPGGEGKKPAPDKTVNGVTFYEMKSDDEVLHYQVKGKVGDNVFGYSTLALKDTYDKALEVIGGVKLQVVTYGDDGNIATSRTLVPGEDFTLTHSPSTKETDGVLQASFGNEFDYTQVAGKTLLMEFDARIKSGGDLSGYPGGKVPNRVSIIFNAQPGEEVTVYVVPPSKPEVEKKVEGKDTYTLTEDFNKTFTYSIKTVIPSYNTESIKGFLLKDTLSEALVIQGTPTVVTSSGDTEGIHLVVDGRKVTVAIEDEKLEDYKGQTLTLAIQGKIDTTTDAWKEYLVDGAIPNTVIMEIPDKPDLTSTVYVKVPLGEVTLKKTAYGDALPEGTSATFLLYRQVGAKPGPGDLPVGTYQTRRVGQEDRIVVKDLPLGSYYFVETVPPKGYVRKEEPHAFTVSLVEGKVVTTGLGNFANFTVDNVSTDIPNPKKEQREKGVGDYGKDLLYLSKWNKEIQYKIDVPVVQVEGWKKFLLTDPVDPDLFVSDVKVEIINSEDKTLFRTYEPGGVSEEDGAFTLSSENLITFSLTNSERLKELEGKTVVLSFQGKIKDIGEYYKRHRDGFSKNKGALDVGYGGKATNEVVLAPPGETPKPIKSINGYTGEAPLKLGAKDQEFFYDVRVKMPMNLAGYRTLVLSDTLENVLETDLEKVKVYVNDLVDDSLRSFLEVADVEVDGKTCQRVALVIDNEGKPSSEQFDFQLLKDKTLRLEIPGAFKKGLTEEDLAPYMIDGEGVVPNDATLRVNDKEEVSNVVKVTPPGDEPEVKKEIRGGTDGRKNLKNKDEKFTYEIPVTIPKNVEGFEKVVLEDTLDEALVKTDVRVHWPLGYTGEKPSVVENGQKLTLTLEKDFDKLAGKKVTMVITAMIRSDLSLEEIAQNYGNSEIPNEATLTFKDRSKNSNVVLVVPPGGEPDPVKTVEGKEAVTLGNIKDAFYYDISYTVPRNVRDLEQLTLTDTLEKVLVTKAEDLRVYVNNVEEERLTDLVTVTSTAPQQVTLDLAEGKLGKDFFDKLAGSTIRLNMKVFIREGADLSDYTHRTIPNEAILKVKNDGVVTPHPSNTVTVTPPTGTVVLTKLADGRELTGTEEGIFDLYKVVGEIDTDGNDEGSLSEKKDLPVKIGEKVNASTGSKITITGLEPGRYYFVETKAPEGYTLDPSPIPFTIEEDQVVAKTLTWNNFTTWKPHKTVNHEGAIVLEEFDKPFTYRISVPVGGDVSKLRKMVIEDTVDPLLTLLPGTAKVTDGDGIPVEGSLIFEDGKITFTKTEDFEAIKNTVVTLTFDAKLKEGISPSKIKGALQKDERGIPNRATVTFNDKPRTTEDVYVKPLLGSVELTKTADGKNLTSEQVALFDLYRGTEVTEENRIGKNLSTDGDGILKVGDLIPGVYTFLEVSPPEGYVASAEPISVKVLGGVENVAKIVVDNRSVRDVTVEKTWIGGDEDNRPEISVQLYRTAGGVTSTVGTPVALDGIVDSLETTSWKYTWKGLPKYDESNREYTYSVDEIFLPEGYGKVVGGDMEKGFTVTNTFEAEKTNITAWKNWVSGPKVKPDIELTLYRSTDGTESGVSEEKVPQGILGAIGLGQKNPVVLKNGEITYTWKNLPRGDGGETYHYYVKETKIGDEVVEGGRAAGFVVMEEGTIVRNTLEEEKMDLFAMKKWKGGLVEDHVEPAFVLYRNGVSLDAPTPEVTKVDESTYLFQWKDLDKQDDLKVPYVYGVEEQGTYENYRKREVTGTGTSKDPFIVVNEYASALTTHKVMKVWKNGGTPHPVIEVQLYQGDTPYGEPVALVNGKTEYTWTGLPKDDNGVPMVYSVKEITINGQGVSEGNPGGYEVTEVTKGSVTTITNDFKVEKINLSGKKSWQGDAEEVRPDSVTIELLRDGKPMDPEVKKVVTAKDDWTYTFEGLDKTTLDGRAYGYSVLERDVPEGYTPSYEGMDVTNTYGEKGQLVIRKTWIDDGKDRPSTISFSAVQLKDGKETGRVMDKVFTVTDDNVYVIGDLPKFDPEDNKAYSYTVVEAPIPGYTTTYEEKEDHFLVTNRREEEISIPFRKVWVGGGNHPEVTFTLYANDAPFRDKEGNPRKITIPANAAGGDLEGIFDGLPAFDDKGRDIAYTILEDPVFGYTGFVSGGERSGFTFTNVPVSFPGLLLLKVDKKTQELLSGAVFDLYRLEEDSEFVATSPEEAKGNEGQKSPENPEVSKDSEEEMKGTALGEIPSGDEEVLSTSEKSPGPEREVSRENTPLAPEEEGLAPEKEDPQGTDSSVEGTEHGTEEEPIKGEVLSLKDVEPQEENSSLEVSSKGLYGFTPKATAMAEDETLLGYARELAGLDALAQWYRLLLEALEKNEPKEGIESLGTSADWVLQMEELEKAMAQGTEDLAKVEENIQNLTEGLRANEETLGVLMAEDVGTEESGAPIEDGNLVEFQRAMEDGKALLLEEEGKKEDFIEGLKVMGEELEVLRAKRDRSLEFEKTREELLNRKGEILGALLEELGTAAPELKETLQGQEDLGRILQGLGSLGEEQKTSQLMEWKDQLVTQGLALEVLDRTATRERWMESFQEWNLALENIEMAISQGKAARDQYLVNGRSPMVSKEYGDPQKAMDTLTASPIQWNIENALKTQGAKSENSEVLKEGTPSLEERVAATPGKEGLTEDSNTEGGLFSDREKEKMSSFSPGAKGEKKSGEVFVERRTTDETGKILFENLKPGTYLLREVKAPSGYLLEEGHGEYVVEVKADGSTTPLKVENEKIPEEPEEPDKPCPTPCPCPPCTPSIIINNNSDSSSTSNPNNSSTSNSGGNTITNTVTGGGQTSDYGKEPKVPWAPAGEGKVPAYKPTPVPNPISVSDPIGVTAPGTTVTKPVMTTVNPVSVTSSPRRGRWTKSPQTYDPGLGSTLGFGGLALLGLAILEWKKRKEK